MSATIGMSMSLRAPSQISCPSGWPRERPRGKGEHRDDTRYRRDSRGRPHTPDQGHGPFHRACAQDRRWRETWPQGAHRLLDRTRGFLRHRSSQPEGGSVRGDRHMNNNPKRRTTMNSRTVRRSVTLALGALFALVILGMTQALAIGHNSSHADGPDFDAIDAYVQEQMQEMRMPGMAIGIVKGDEIVHLQGFGDADDTGREVTPQTPFKIGSTTKSFTALAIMQLVEAGKVEL